MPTLGKRSDFLVECLESLKTNRGVFVCVVSPSKLDITSLIDRGLVNSHVMDKGLGLPSAINDGIKSLPPNLEFVAWLGDDDFLEPKAIQNALSEIGVGDVAIFGNCNYVNEKSELFWTLKTGPWAVRMLTWGPNKVPQPGSLIRRSALEAAGFLDESLGWAFDQDLFIKLRSIGRVRYINETLANFRWHSASLSSGSSRESVIEASSVRIRHTKRRYKWLALVREFIHTRLAFAVESSLDRRKSRTS